MNDRTTITAVEPRHRRWVRVTFADGAIHEINLEAVFARGGVFAPIRDDQTVFEGVAVDPESHTICWPGEIDLDPDVLRGDEPPASGTRYPRRIIIAV